MASRDQSPTADAAQESPAPRESAHNPGPWTTGMRRQTNDYLESVLCVLDAKGCAVAMDVDEDCARLIVAAPALVAALAQAAVELTEAANIIEGRGLPMAGSIFRTAAAVAKRHVDEALEGSAPKGVAAQTEQDATGRPS